MEAAFAAANATIDNTGRAKAQSALTKANNECMNGFRQRHPGEGDGDCRVVAVGAMLSTGVNVYYGEAYDNSNHAELGGKNQWQAAWDTYIKPNTYRYAGAQSYNVNYAFNDDPTTSVQKIMWDKTFDGKCKVNPAWGSDVCNLGGAAVNKSIVVIVLDKYHPAPPSFTPTISTEAPTSFRRVSPSPTR